MKYLLIFLALVIQGLSISTMAQSANSPREKLRIGIAPFEWIGMTPTSQQTLADPATTLQRVLSSQGYVNVSLLKSSTYESTFLPDPNTSVLPFYLREGRWRTTWLAQPPTSWDEVARTQKCHVLIQGVVEFVSSEVRYQVDLSDPVTQSLYGSCLIRGPRTDVFTLEENLGQCVISSLEPLLLPKSQADLRSIARQRAALSSPKSDTVLSGESTATADSHYENGVTLARRFDQTGDRKFLEGAIEEYRAALAKDPNHFRSLNNLGTAYHRLGSLDDALTCYQKVLDLNPTYARAMENIALVYQVKGERDKAVEMWRNALKYEDRAEIRTSIEKTLQDLEGGAVEANSPGWIPSQ